MMWILMSILPGASVAFLIAMELPFGLKRYIYRMPTWLVSTLINILIVTPLAGWMVGPLAVFMGEFIVWPVMAWDSKRTSKIVETIEKAGMKVGAFENNKKVLIKYHKAKSTLRGDKTSAISKVFMRLGSIVKRAGRKSEGISAA